MSEKKCGCGSDNKANTKAFYTAKQQEIINRIKKVTQDREPRYKTKNKLFI